ncbi:MAG: glycoside hydrolase family 95 protein, partial [Bacteroidales bacterium]|nr:glycoside hydrolase family 95 protein [Bacteroidales bacterium]
RPTGDTGYNMADGGGTYNNLLCAHPPFQLDGNMGAIAGIAEMLYNPVHNSPLPALPSSWKNGYIKGLRTQNGNTINIYWQNNKLTKVENY